MPGNKFLIVCFILLFSIGVASARFTLYEEGTQIEGNYTEGDFIGGELNITFSSQENRNFTSNTKGTISLLDILLKSQYRIGSDFTCVPGNCKDDLISDDLSQGNESVKFKLDKKNFYGFKLAEGAGRASNVSEFRFNFTSDVQSSCTNQIEIDIFNDGKIDFYNNVHSGEICGEVEENYGCFKDDREVEDDPAIIEKDVKYCEKIELPSAPGYRVGAHVTKRSSGDRGIQLRLYEILESGKGDHIDGCTIGYERFGDGRTDVFCNINYSGVNLNRNKIGFFVCVKAESDSDYKIRYREANNSCGGAGFPDDEVLDLSTDYEIYARPLEYAAINKIKLDEEFYEQLNDGDLIDKANQYLTSTYKNNCPEEGCIIPIAFKGVSQNITLDDGRIEYKIGRNSREEKKFYELFEREARLSSNGSFMVDVSKMQLETPTTGGYSEFNLYFDGDEILNERIYTVVGFSFGIGPRSVLLGKKTTFVIHSERNITSSTWNFGDDSAPISEEGIATSHTYLTEGEYLVDVTAVDKRGESSRKKFRVSVGEPKRSAEILIADEKERIQNLKQSLNSYPVWMKNALQTKLAVQEKENSLTEIENKFKALGSGANESAYIAIVESLLDLEVPDALLVTERGTLPADIGYGKIDVNLIAEISGAQNIDEENTKAQILKWIENNYAIEISFETVSALYGIEEEKIATKYTITATQKSGFDGNYPYLIIRQPMTKIVPGSSQQLRELGNKQAVYFSLDPTKSKETFDFLISDSLDVDELGVYISPVLQNLGEGGKPFDTNNLFVNQDGSFRWGFFLLWISILIVCFLAAYVLLQTWYKRNYERKLFKNPDDLYNIINFIYNSRRYEMKDNETRKKLLERRWGREQVNYAFKKIDGKRTGMLEIPLFKFMENRKVKRELEKKQHGQTIDIRFIKHPSL